MTQAATIDQPQEHRLALEEQERRAKVLAMPLHEVMVIVNGISVNGLPWESRDEADHRSVIVHEAKARGLDPNAYQGFGPKASNGLRLFHKVEDVNLSAYVDDLYALGFTPVDAWSIERNGQPSAVIVFGATSKGRREIELPAYAWKMLRAFRWSSTTVWANPQGPTENPVRVDALEVRPKKPRQGGKARSLRLRRKRMKVRYSLE